MQLLECSFLADENIPPQVVEALVDTASIARVPEEGLLSANDTTILQAASRQGLVLITQDSDFCELVFANRLPFFGVIYLRPGHLLPEIPLRLLRHVSDASLEVEPPFFLVAALTADGIKLRLRNAIHFDNR